MRARLELLELVRRAGVVGLGLLAMTAGLALGSTGCEQCECGEVIPIDVGTYEVVASERWPALVGGVVEVTDEQVVLSFVDGAGIEWVVEYAVTDN